GFPSDNLNAATTNLFYLNNKVHDIFYRLGFTESARNFQSFNFGKGGAQNDYVLAESQDGSGKDNANFATPSDGSKPRMQMFLWNPLVVNRLFYNAPAGAVTRMPATQNSVSFGASLNATGITANVLISPVLDACTALPTNYLIGTIGLAERGTCAFTVKTKNMQNAGAVAAIIYNATTSVGFGGMGGTDASINIPAILIENTEGEYIKSQINAGINVNTTLKFDDNLVKYRDGSFDSGIVAHEYGHGISNRLEPSVTCLNTSSDNEQMGEGWSDFFALMLTNKPNDDATVPRGVRNLRNKCSS
ncbi:M36 family metallopeptidase, partial [Halpernia sp. GG3]